MDDSERQVRTSEVAVDGSEETNRMALGERAQELGIRGAEFSAVAEKRHSGRDYRRDSRKNGAMLASMNSQ